LNTNNIPDILTINNLQEILKIGRSTAYKLIGNNKIRYFRVGNAIRIPKAALMEYVEKSAGICHNGPCSSQANPSCHEEGVYVL